MQVHARAPRRRTPHATGSHEEDRGADADADADGDGDGDGDGVLCVFAARSRARPDRAGAVFRGEDPASSSIVEEGFVEVGKSGEDVCSGLASSLICGDESGYEVAFWGDGKDGDESEEDFYVLSPVRFSRDNGVSRPKKGIMGRIIRWGGGKQ